MTLNEIQEKLADWHVRAKGVLIDPHKTIIKVMEELGELAKALLRGDKENAIEELADCFITLSHLARFFKVDIVEIMADKYLILEKRLKDKKK